MNILFDKSFLKDILRERDTKRLAKIKECILNVELAFSIKGINSIKKLKGYDNYYRIKIDYSYRIGVKIEENIVIFVMYENRKDIYKYFP